MIRILLTFLFLFLSVNAYPFGGMMCASGGSSDVDAGGPPSCDPTVQWDHLGTSGTGGSSAYACNKWVIAANITVTGYVGRYKYNAGSGTVGICIMPDNGGTPSKPTGTCIAGTEKTLSNTDMTVGVMADYTHTLASPTDVDAATVWVCTYEGGSMDRLFEYHSATGETGCYGATAAGCTIDSNYIDASVDVYGCLR